MKKSIKFIATGLLLATLILPLGINDKLANVDAKRRPRTTLIRHRRNKRRKSHRYYKFAYSKKEYNLALKHIKNSKYHYNKFANQLAKREPKRINKRIFKKGVFDSYANMFNKKLGNNHAYYLGYIQGTRKASGYTEPWKNCTKEYNFDKRNGVGVRDYITYFKQQAHYNML